MNKGFENALLALLASVLLISCSTDPKNPIEVGEKLISSYATGDSSSIFQIEQTLLLPRHSSSGPSSPKMDSVLAVWDREDVERGKKDVKKRIALFQGSEYTLLKIDTITEKTLNYEPSTTTNTVIKDGVVETFYTDKATGKRTDREHYSLIEQRKHLVNILFKLDTSYYRMESEYYFDSLGNLYFKKATTTMKDLSFACKNAFEKIYIPTSVEGEITVQTDYRGQTFKGGKARIKNGTNYEIEFIRFRIVMTDRRTRKEFFNQSTSSNTVIPVDDIVEIDIPGLRDYYVGPVLSNIQDWYYSYKTLEVLPKPDSHFAPCKELAEAKKLDK